MANTLTNLIPDAYAALDVVSRELTGFIPSVARDPQADMVAVGQTLRIPQTAANSAGGNITAAMAFPAAADQTVGNKTLTISKSRFYPFSWNGEEQKAAPGYLSMKQDQIAQAMRGLVNEMEADVWAAAYKGGSRGYGTAGATPFASTLADPANIKKILDDNGAPFDRSLVIDTTAGAKMRTLAQLTKANEAGDTSLLRQGTLLDIHGFAVRESAQVAAVAAGAMASATTTAAVLAIGQTVLPLATAGTGVVAAGDLITLANDANIYVVSSVSFAGANPASGDSITIAAPGLKVAQASAARAITVIAASTRNVAFSRNAILLASRLPAVPVEGDLATDRQTIVDDRTGIAFELAVYPGFRMNVYHVSAAWGVSVVKPEHVAVLLG